MTIPPPTPLDFEADPAEHYTFDFGYCGIPQPWLQGWIRRAVAAEARVKELEAARAAPPDCDACEDWGGPSLFGAGPTPCPRCKVAGL